MKIIGVMSGTSLDGLDLALCEFKEKKNKIEFKILASQTVNYNPLWKNKLNEAKNLSAENYFALHAEYGKFIAEKINQFQKVNKRNANAIASHGHTVFHQPQKGFSTQIGCGATIAANTGITTVCDFRSLDVALKGQGAPLVPIGDKLLFGEIDACLNIGGIANISFSKKGNRVAYDICEANMLLNFLAEKIGKAFDKNGDIAKQGKQNEKLLQQLNSLDFYKQNGAKSLGREWFEKNVKPLVEKTKISIEDILTTSVEHIATIISSDLNKNKIKSVLITGGGAFNSFLMECIEVKTKCKIILPSKEIINFKEALIFALLGYLRLNEKTNTLKSVTGARSNSVGGAVYFSA